MTWQERRGVHLKIPQQAQKFSERESAMRKVIPLLAARSLVGAIARPDLFKSLIRKLEFTGPEIVLLWPCYPNSSQVLPLSWD